MESGTDLQFLPLADGRTLEVLVEGDADGFPLVYFSGTPSAVLPFPQLDAIARQRHLRVVAWSRPGYAGSTRQPGRRVADAAADASVVLDHLGLDQFVTLGWSGGGPHALACAALVPSRCRAAATLAGVAPHDAPGLDWSAGMGKENVEEFGVALQGEAVLRPFVEEYYGGMRTITAEQLAAGLGDLAPPVDVAHLTGELAELLAAGFRRSVSNGYDGPIDDDLAFANPWGFDVAGITVPVIVWQGSEDRMVPHAHGQWLAAHIPGAAARLLDGEGHISLVTYLDRVVDDLMVAGGVG